MFVKVGDVVAGYQIEGLLGKGGMGCVYRARAEDGRVVAVKVMNEDCSPERFRTEAQTLSQMQHPGIPQVYHFSLEPFAYMVQERMGGVHLEELLSQGRMPISQALSIANSLLAVLQVIHEYGFVHRDLSPSNILVRENQACIIDFGLVRVPDSAFHFTKTGEIMGTLHYLAPEQIDPELGPTTPRTDLFAVGALVYHMLTGSTPAPQGSSIPRVLRQILLQDPPPMQGIPQALALACLKALAKQPSARYQSALEFAAALRSAAHQEGAP